jgi:hypothetical protein
MQGCTEMIGGDEEILSPLLLSEYVPGAAGMDLEFTAEEICCLRNYVVVMANPGELPRPLKRRESLLEFRGFFAGEGKGAGDCRCWERIIL